MINDDDVDADADQVLRVFLLLVLMSRCCDRGVVLPEHRGLLFVIRT